MYYFSNIQMEKVGKGKTMKILVESAEKDSSNKTKDDIKSTANGSATNQLSV